MEFFDSSYYSIVAQNGYVFDITPDQGGQIAENTTTEITIKSESGKFAICVAQRTGNQILVWYVKQSSAGFTMPSFSPADKIFGSISASTFNQTLRGIWGVQLMGQSEVVCQNTGNDPDIDFKDNDVLEWVYLNGKWRHIVADDPLNHDLVAPEGADSVGFAPHLGKALKAQYGLNQVSILSNGYGWTGYNSGYWLPNGTGMINSINKATSFLNASIHHHLFLIVIDLGQLDASFNMSKADFINHLVTHVSHYKTQVGNNTNRDLTRVPVLIPGMSQTYIDLYGQSGIDIEEGLAEAASQIPYAFYQETSSFSVKTSASNLHSNAETCRTKGQEVYPAAVHEALKNGNVIVNTPVTGVPTISGTLVEGSELTVDTASIADTDGLGAFSYQWLRDGVDVTGETATTYTLINGDVGTRISVRVSFTDGGGSNESVTSAQTSLISAIGNSSATGQPTISGTAEVGQTLTSDTAAIADADGLGVFSYQWLRNGAPIAGASSASYIVSASDIGYAISLEVSFTDGGGYSELVVSAATAVVPPPANTPATGSPTISGNGTTVGSTLNVDTAGIADADGLGPFTYQWQRNGSDISGATNSSYVCVAGDVGTTITVDVSFTDGYGYNETLTSNGIGPITGTDTEAPVITLTGDDPYTISQGSTWVDPGYSATDNVDGDITGNVNVSGTVDTSTPGDYTLTYTVSDAAGNAATPVTRDVTVAALPQTPVADSLSPTVLLTRNKNIAPAQWDSFGSSSGHATQAAPANQPDITAEGSAIINTVDYLILPDNSIRLTDEISIVIDFTSTVTIDGLSAYLPIIADNATLILNRNFFRLFHIGSEDNDLTPFLFQAGVRYKLGIRASVAGGFIELYIDDGGSQTFASPYATVASPNFTNRGNGSQTYIGKSGFFNNGMTFELHNLFIRNGGAGAALTGANLASIAAEQDTL